MPPPPVNWQYIRIYSPGGTCSGMLAWTFDLENGVQVTCDVGYLCANFSLPRPLCSRVTPDVRKGSPHHTWFGHHFQGQKVKVTRLLYSPAAVLARQAAAAVGVRTYWAWETTAALRVLGGVRHLGTHRRRGAGGHATRTAGALQVLSTPVVTTHHLRHP